MDTKAGMLELGGVDMTWEIHRGPGDGALARCGDAEGL